MRYDTIKQLKKILKNMPIHWKILSKNYLLNIFLFTLFFIFITIFFKLSKFAKYFIGGLEIKELALLLGVFIYRCIPFGISITALISSYLVCSSSAKNNEITAFASLGCSPKKLFFPLILLSIFLGMSAGYVNFALSPYINSGLRKLLREKKENMDILSSLSKRGNKKDIYININKDDGSDFLYINTGKDFSWALCDLVTEDREGLYFSHPYYFRALSEKKGFDTIILSEDKQSFVSKGTLFSTFPNSTLRIDSIKYSWQQTISILFYLLYPISFTLLGIMLSLHIYPYITGILTICVFIAFSIATLQLTFISAGISFVSFLFCSAFYPLILRKYMAGIA